ncbi:four-carbon acid sugar kinase family protein [Microlunatus speluncae]|uniref:four-carbon acid sugar kinase family protein n=1 Tax=Microlunatus speluncae TaxID=2594267 RepID=UPI0012660D27|nr:four-carbon acid sugar kinase family protein [Microlunatus speluncae]
MDHPVPESSLLASLPPARIVPADELATACASGRRLAVLDDDPTGNQTIKDLPVVTRWAPDDLRWAMRQDTAAFFVLTNSRGLAEPEAARLTREVARACLAVAAEEGIDLAFASRSDSTLRGHFPLEPDLLAAESAAAGQPVDAVIINPSYLDAGRITVDSVHWVRTDAGMVPVGSTDYAADATFGFSSSELTAWVAEKTGGRVDRSAVGRITVAQLRTLGPEGVAAALAELDDHGYVVTDAVTDDDLRVLALGILAAERSGRRFVYRVGPSFVRARSGQVAAPPIDDATLRALLPPTDTPSPGGLIVVGSHVSLSSRQLRLLTERVGAVELELVPAKIIAAGGAAEDHLRDLAERAAAALPQGNVVIKTSRELVRGDDGEQSLAISRRVSVAVVELVRMIMERQRPAFVVAKGGVTSSDVATEALGIRRAWVRGTLLPGIVSLWEPVDGPATGLPYVVFAGNVGTDDSLADVVQRFDQARTFVP